MIYAKTLHVHLTLSASTKEEADDLGTTLLNALLPMAERHPSVQSADGGSDPAEPDDAE